jgi:maltose alpha-D-glucosyltransferase/alpha-amylase
MAGDSFSIAAELGRVTGELHLALASAGDEEPDFLPESTTAGDVEEWVQGAEQYLDQLVSGIRHQLELIPSALPAGTRQALTALVRDPSDIRRQLRGMLVLAADNSWKMRVHGDYHLSQLLRASSPEEAGGVWVVLDFEGEPARPLAERRRKQSPLRDVASMLRSFDYVTRMAIREYNTDDFMVREALHRWGELWLGAAREAFLESYLEALGGAPLVPGDRDRFHHALSAFELEKAIRELGYEMNSRPDWMWVPLRGIQTIRERSGA